MKVCLIQIGIILFYAQINKLRKTLELISLGRRCIYEDKKEEEIAKFIYLICDTKTLICSVF